MRRKLIYNELTIPPSLVTNLTDLVMNYQVLKNDFIKYFKDKGRTESTLLAYNKDLEQFGDFLNTQKISDILKVDSEIIKKYLEDSSKKNKFSPKTVSRKINSLRTFFKFLNAKKVISDNPALKVEHPKLSTSTTRILSSFEYRAIRDVSRNDLRYYTIIELILQTGLRISEITRLKVEDINFVNEQKGTLIVTSYSSIPERTIELNQQAITALNNYFEKFIKGKKNSSDFLFYTKNGSPILIRNLRSSLNNIFRKAEIKGVNVNDLRNTFITFQLQHGVPIEKVAEIAGHKKTTSTEKYYKLLETKPEKYTNQIGIL